MSKHRNYYLDFLRGIAILAVLYDHGYYFYPGIQNNPLHDHTVFSVVWFIVLSGFANSFSSLKKSWHFPTSLLVFWKKRLVTIIFPYVLASIISYLAIRAPWSFKDFLIRFINFNTLTLFYFMSVLLGLYILFPFIFSIIYRYKKNLLIVSALVFIISYLSLNVFNLSKTPWYYSINEGIIALAYLFPFIVGILAAFYHERYRA
jgi:peptidoglycan/LPS O-acetylase OafA/YrhL